MNFHEDTIRDARNAAREELTRNVREAAKLVKLAVALGVCPTDKKIPIIKLLREQSGIDLRSAKDAVDLAIELRAA